jgi:hypothetical protein
VDISKLLYPASTWVVPVLIAITFHEAAHGYAAWRLGDDTALRHGRVTFNPLKHVDPFGTILVPALLLLTASPLCPACMKTSWPRVPGHRIRSALSCLFKLAGSASSDDAYLASWGGE